MTLGPIGLLRRVEGVPVVGRVARRFRRRLEYKAHKHIILSSGLFDVEWYLKTYPDVTHFRGHPAAHYVMYGASEGRNPSAQFNSNWYRSAYRDITARDANPLVHYLLHGKAEGRLTDAPPRPHWITPLDPLTARDIAGPFNFRIAIQVHIYYPDLAEELLDACLNVPGDVDILATATSLEGEDCANAWARRHGFPSLTVKRVMNRGRDVAAFTAAFGLDILAIYDLFCHIHTKKSLYSGREQVEWRRHYINH